MEKEKIVVDVRIKEQFEQGSVPQARSIPLEDLNNRLDELDRNAAITVVCNRGGQRSQNAVRLLKENGYSDAEVLEGGVDRWKAEHQK